MKIKHAKQILKDRNIVWFNYIDLHVFATQTKDDTIREACNTLKTFLTTGRQATKKGMDKMDTSECREFYLEHCVDREKGEIPLDYIEWLVEVYPDDVAFFKENPNTKGE